ncbi:MAG: 7-carboxy-7-deazaguanine synthase QueE [Bacteroidales bacterium]
MHNTNEQRIASGLWLPLMEEFYTLQGEGYHTGKPAYFIRVGGCDNACHWCDTKASWNAALYPLVHINEIIERAKACAAGAVVVTGGEPLNYNLNPLCSGLKTEGLSVFLETSGSAPLSGEWDWICLSPKRKIPVHSDLFLAANELKVVVLEDSYLEFAEQLAEKVNSSALLYLQPEWSRRNVIMPRIIEYIKANPKWRISLQSHKYMQIP